MASMLKLKQAIKLLSENLDVSDESVSQALKTLEVAITDKKFTSKINNHDEVSREHLPKPEIVRGEIAAYSDGACRGNPGPGAWAFIVQADDGELLYEKFDVEELTTNNRMELKGVIKGLSFLLHTEHSDKKIVYFTDSRYVVDGITKWVWGWKARGWRKADNKAPENLELWQELDELNQQLKVRYIWVRGHAGHEQNEYCDRLANKALDEYGH